MRVFVIAGSPSGQPPATLAPGPGDRVIAADYGAHHARVWGWPLHLLAGDLDSLPGAEAAALRDLGVPVVVAPRAKDETDLELALALALDLDPDEIVICAALGGRTDHLLANLLLLARPELAGVRAVIADGPVTVHLLRGGVGGAHLELAGAAGDLLSLLPIGGDAGGVTTRGLVYPLRDETLFLGWARGVSNVFESGAAQVWLRAGLLLLVHTRNSRAHLSLSAG
jgi:thiamine pyrophosphokinase